MDKEIKKKLTRNWFKLLQNTICNDIEKLEKNNPGAGIRLQSLYNLI